ncbi:MAG: VOC family protein [Candidatus Sumerlaeia bacterium]
MKEHFLGTDHPAIAVADVDAMADWYCDTLGYTKKAGKAGGPWLLAGPDGVYLEVMRQDDSPRPERANLTPGWSHLALRVDNLDAAIEALDAKKVQWTAEIVGAVGGGRLRNFVDPDGNAWQIVERS